MFDILGLMFMQNALLAGLLASIACGIIGTYVVVKRVVFISGGISHSSFGGIGIARFLGFEPLLGALLFAVTSALGIGLLSSKTREREDTSIGILWVVGMAIGVVFIHLTPGYGPDLFSYLFGSILTVPTGYLYYLLALDISIIMIMALFYKEMLATSFDEEYSKVSAVPTMFISLLMLALVAITVVALIKIVGVILVIALLTIPAAVAGKFTHDLRRMMLVSAILGMAFIIVGLWTSVSLDLEPGATIVIVAGLAFLFSHLYAAIGSHSARRASQ
jgi:zinc transport system permease protein